VTISIIGLSFPAPSSAILEALRTLAGPDPDPDHTQIKPELRNRIRNVFSIAIKAMVKSMDAMGTNFRVIVGWLQTFLPLGDGVRRIFARILSDDIDHALFFAGLTRINEQSTELLVKFPSAGPRLAPVFPFCRCSVASARWTLGHA
jgi:hypothetical protein